MGMLCTLKGQGIQSMTIFFLYIKGHWPRENKNIKKIPLVARLCKEDSKAKGGVRITLEVF